MAFSAAGGLADIQIAKIPVFSLMIRESHAESGSRKLLRRVAWHDFGVKDAWIFSPERVRGALVKNPRALGEAFKTLMRGELTPDWRSSDGLEIDAIELH